MKFQSKGMLSPFTIMTSVLTGVGFPLLGSFVALDIGVVDTLYINGLILVAIGGFLAHWVLAHCIHDLYQINIENRVTFSKKTLRMLLIISLVVLSAIGLYLAFQRGWPVIVFAIIGLLATLYAEGLLHFPSQMAIGAMFLVIGSFYVQVGTLDLDYVVWLKVICIAMFSYISQYGWLKIYRLDDYEYSDKLKNKNILLTKSALIFLILYVLL